MLSVVKGQVWLTETGGLVKFGKDFPRSPKRAASRTKYMFALARSYKRREADLRLPLDFGEPRSARFDAGLVNPDGSARPAFTQFRRASRACPASRLVRTAGGTR